MLKAIQPVQPKTLAEPNSPALQNPALAHCVAVWESTYQSVLTKTRSDYDATREASQAFRSAMPPLNGYDNICDFIACTSFAILVGAINDDSGSRLLYAAQVALTAIPAQAKIPARRDAAPAPLAVLIPTPSPTLLPTPTKQES